MINAYAAKRSVFARLALLNQPGGPLETVAIAGIADPEPIAVVYEWPGRQPGRVCVYLGGVTYERTPDAADGDDELALEVDTVGVYVRVVRPVTDEHPVAVGEDVAEAIAKVILDEIRRDPTFGGSFAYSRPEGGTGDHVVGEDEAIVILAINLDLYSYAT